MKLFRFPDEDVVTINLVSNLSEGTWVNINETVLDIDSLADSANEKILEARVRRLKAQTNVYYSGELQARYEEALAMQALTETNVASYFPLVERRRDLVKKGVLSDDELQLAEDEYFRRLQAVDVARSAAYYRKSQASPSVLAMADAELEEAERELALVRARLSSHLVKTPIDGRVTRLSGDPAILLRVVRENKLVARIIVPVIFMDKVNIGDKVRLTFSGHKNLVMVSEVKQIDVQSIPVLGQSILHLLVPVNNPSNILSVSLTGNAMLNSVEINPLHLLWYRVKSMFDNSLTKETVYSSDNNETQQRSIK